MFEQFLQHWVSESLIFMVFHVCYMLHSWWSSKSAGWSSKSLARESNAVWWHSVWSRLGPWLHVALISLIFVLIGISRLWKIANADVRSKISSRRLFGGWRTFAPSTCPWWRLAMNMVCLRLWHWFRFKFFVGDDVFQKWCSPEDVDYFFMVPVNSYFILHRLTWLVKMPTIASVPKCVLHPARSIPRDQQKECFQRNPSNEVTRTSMLFLPFPCQISGSKHSDEFLSEQCSFRGGGMGWTCPG